MNPSRYTRDMSPHKAEACQSLSPIGQRGFRYIEFDDNEQMVAEIRKHPIGILFLTIGGIFVGLMVLITASWAALHVDKLGFDFGDSLGTVRTIIMSLGVLLAVIIGVVLLINAIIYRSNVVFLTNDKIAEVTYQSLFNRRVIQQSIGRIEDVTVIQRGILPRIFDYGTLIVETAGEKQNLTFSFIPTPSQNSQLIIKCHEDSIKAYGN